MNSPDETQGKKNKNPSIGSKDLADRPAPKRSFYRREWIPLWLHLAWLETRSHPAFTFGFILNVCLGLIGFLTLDAFKASIEWQLSSKSQAAIGADISIWASRLVTDGEMDQIRAALPSDARVRKETSLLSMATGLPEKKTETMPQGQPMTRLVEIRAVDEGFPYYGELLLTKQGPQSSQSPKDIVDQPHVWISPELGLQMGLSVGDSLKLGNSVFKITDTVDYDPTAMPSGLAFAPRVFVGQRFLQETGLIGLGARLWQGVLIALSSTTHSNPEAGGQKKVSLELADQRDELKKRVSMIRSALGRTDMRVRSHVAAANDRNRALVYLNDYLGLVALVSLFLAAVGGSFLFQSFLSRRASAIATLSALGLKRLECRLVYGSQLILLGLLATTLTVVLSLGVLPALPWILKGILPEGIEPKLHLQSTFLALLLATVGNLIVCFPILYRLGSLKASRLFQEGQGGGLQYQITLKDLWTWLPAMLTFWGLAVFQAHSFKVGSLFIGIFMGALAVFAGLSLLILRSIREVGLKGRFLAYDLALVSLVRHRTATVASFVAIALGSLLVNLIPAIKELVERELESPQGKAPPSLFLIDIQEEQKDPLIARVPSLTGGVPLEKVSPFIRARLVAINGDESRVQTPVEDESYTTREEQESERFINRGYNLSYRDHLLTSEEVVAGQFFQASPHDVNATQKEDTSSSVPEISLEQRFAERLGLALGDTLSFDIEGVIIDGRITSMRKVKWSSFDPNFFVIFEPGVLEQAPKTYIATIPSLSTEVKAQTELQIVSEFPNVSMIDISKAAERVLSLANQMSQALSLMAALTLVSGLAVLFAIAHHQAQKRVIEITLLKVMGSEFSSIRALSLIEFGLLGFTASGMGSFLSLGASLLLARGVFETDAPVNLMTPLMLTLILGTTCTLTGYLALRRILRTKPALLLGEALFEKS